MEAWLLTFLNWLTRVYQQRYRRRQAPPAPTGWVLGSVTAVDGSSTQTLALTNAEFDRHLYVLGASGSGKTKFLELLLREHLQQDAGFCLVDPHGDLVECVLAYLCEERRRMRRRGEPLDLRRVYLIEPFREDGIIGINPLDAGGGPLYPHIGELVGIFRRFWSGSWGPRMEELLRNTLLALALTGNTLVEVTPFLTDAGFRARTLAQIPDDVVVSYWRDRFDVQSEAAQAAMAEPVLNKIGALLADPRLRATFGQQQTLHIRQLMDQGAWVLLNCAKGHLRDASYIFGSLVVAQLQAAAMSRADIPEASRRPFTLVVDEFQNCRGEDFETILCESRKYKLRLVLAHQHLAQLDPSLQNAIFGNVASRLIFAVSAGDAAVAVRGLPEEAGALPNLTQLPVGRAMLFRRGQPILSVQILSVLTPKVPRERLGRFAAALRRQHGRNLAAIEADLHRRRYDAPSSPERPQPRKTRKSAKPKRSTAAAVTPALPVPQILEALDD